MSHSTLMLRTVPVGTDGLEGWTSCCEASVTFSGEATLCCKACWHEVLPVGLDGEQGDALSRIVRDVIGEAITADEGVAAQRHLLASS